MLGREAFDVDVSDSQFNGGERNSSPGSVSILESDRLAAAACRRRQGTDEIGCRRRMDGS